MIYFIRPVGQGRIKIGYTDGRVTERVSELQTGCPVLHELLAVLDGGKETESSLHEHFSPYRLHGEWFEANSHLIRLVAGLMSESEGPPFGYYASFEPRLWELAEKCGTAHHSEPGFDALSFFYDEIKPQLGELVGWGSGREVPRVLRTETAYDVVYQTLLRLIPDPKSV